MNELHAKLGSRAARGPCECKCEITAEISAGGSLAPSFDLLHRRSADSSAATLSTYRSTVDKRSETANGLGCRAQGSGSRRETTSEASPQEGKLGVCLEAEVVQLAVEDANIRQWRSLRPCEIVRLLNSTPLGPVIHDRQLYRHRQRAPWIQSGGGRIDLTAYCAWLVVQSRSKRKPRKRRVVGRETLSLDELRDLLQRQNYRCALTGEQLTPSNFALDHIVPLSDGGDFTAANSQLVLKAVNRAKNTMRQSDFVEMCRKVARHCDADGVV